MIAPDMRNDCVLEKTYKILTEDIKMKTFDRKDVFSVLNAEEAKAYIGGLGYFANTLNGFKNIQYFAPYSLDDIQVDRDKPFFYRKDSFALFLPADKVKEVKEGKKWRAFTAEEFLALFKVGDVIQIKVPKLGEINTLVTSVRKNANQLTLGGWDSLQSFETLFCEGVEFLNKGLWQPFGVEE